MSSSCSSVRSSLHSHAGKASLQKFMLISKGKMKEWNNEHVTEGKAKEKSKIKKEGGICIITQSSGDTLQLLCVP